MDINWKVPFEFAFELSLFIIGATLVLVVASIGLLILIGVVKALIAAVRGGKREEKQQTPTFPVSLDGIIGKTKE